MHSRLMSRMEKETSREKKKEEKKKHYDLLDLVFSWSLSDILNQNLFKYEVKEIPDRFSSVADYLSSFILPLVEETRANLCSGLEVVGKAPAREILRLHPCKLIFSPPKKLFGYSIVTRMMSSFSNPGEGYEPESRDLVLLTNASLKGIYDLNYILSEDQFVIASVVKQYNNSFYDFQLFSAKKINSELRPSGPRRIYMTYLTNMTTNIRIWRALSPDPMTANLRLLQKVLQYDPVDDNDCSLCLYEPNSTELKLIDSFTLDNSQKNAVLKCVSMRKCPHQSGNVRLIWGPPGTGKTKTVASLLFVLLKMRCRTLTCAPTNIAVLQVAQRLLNLFVDSLDHDTYGLGDIVLLGNEKRMKVDDHDILVDIFLDYRVKILSQCRLDWRSSLRLLMNLLEDPQQMYNEYVEKHRKQLDNEDETGREELELEKEDEKKKKKKLQNNIFTNSLNEIRKERRQKGNKNEEDSNTELEAEPDNLMTFPEFVVKTFYSLADSVMFCAKNFYTHLPTSCVPLAVVKEMIRLNDQFKTLESRRNNARIFNEVMMKKEEILKIIKLLQEQFPGPIIEGNIQDFCLSNACLVFCTAASSIKVRSSMEMVIMDEAAQLKECESAIPLQNPGVRNAILIGDDRQLPAMVQSKVSEKAKFGNSLFQRLATLGKKKHLLNIQYRMHPTISLFPNKEFYNNKIVDGPNVKEQSYQRLFLKEMNYGTYSFINVPRGKEDFRKGPSPRNEEEVSIIVQIIAKLFKEHSSKKHKVSVGVISPYKGQVGLLEEKLGKKYEEHKKAGFSVSVRSVDGFQGGEEDIIIISTVRSNRNGSVGFLSNRQRTNVALTRARYCLWIVGNGITLVKSGSVWKDLVIDAMACGCFCNVEEYVHVDSSLDFDFLKHGKSRWKIFFCDEFKMSIASLTENETKNKVREMVKKLSQGWRQPVTKKVVTSELLEQYKVDDRQQLYLVWSIDILKEETQYSQVIRIWDILPASELPQLAQKFIISLGTYAADVLNRCKHKSSDGNVPVPMSWAIPSVSLECLAGQLATMNLQT